ncbi:MULTISPECIES: transcriptional regulator [Kitasatospora]|uniref:Transcriptional regulator n=2 Tax=Kitasatospora TaxID=2063 RepID=A0ABT1IUD3_9ACTN|nr:transcriptional regulator [Kitasatospora paracochleata]MCP2308752.1 hypothetical protein [Kitasatospora paracochleata]
MPHPVILAPLPRRRRSTCAPATTFEAALTDLAAEGATGALHGPDGAVHLQDGAVVHAEAPAAADIGTLLTGSGRITVQDWEDGLLLSGGRLAEYLLASGQIGHGELELCRLTALFDAAHFALAQHGGELRFDTEAVPAFRLARPLTAHQLRGAVGRRRSLLDRVWPSAELDRAPLRHRSGPQCRRLSLSPRRCQALLGAVDGERTVDQVARMLGRSTYATLLDVRQLAAAGLLEARPQPAAPPPPPAPVRQQTLPDVLLPPPGPTGHDLADPEVGLLLRLRAALEAL